MSNFKKIIENLSADPSKRGKAFEKYCKWFLKNDPYYSAQLKDVWLWDEWSGNWGRDKGIDLVAETISGKIWAIQVKAYDENYYITKADVDTFLSESSRKAISYRLLIATTNNIGPNAHDVIKAQEKQVGLCLLDKLENSELDWELVLTNQVFIKKDPYKPHPHQRAAINDITKGFETASQGQLHMACGTGKTLVGLWLAQELKSQNTLVLVPSISLVSQLYREWSAHCGEYIFDPIFVCSDKTVSKNEDDEQIDIDSAELGFPVTTTASEIVSEYTETSRPKVIFCTYHSSPVIKEACELDVTLNFDLIIADEAHRCAGKAKSDFALVVDTMAIRSQRKLYMTATPKIFSENVKKKTQECECEIVSMDDDEKFGPVFHTLLFSDAIKQNLLCDYQVVVSVMNNEVYREYAEKGRFITFEQHETDARTLASQLLVAKAIKKYDLKKVISFHSRTKPAKNFIATFSKSLTLLPDHEKPVIAYQDTIISDRQQSERYKILKHFETASDGTALLSNVKCLSEGVDVCALDGIAFIDPKNSEIDIVQAVGRVIRKPKNGIKKIGTIIIPIFVDEILDETQALEQSCFKTVWKVVRALRSHDDTLAEELDTIRLELGKRTYKTPPKLSKIVLDVPVGVGCTFSSAVSVRLVENCSSVSLAQSHPEIAAQWHSIKNGDLTPDDVTAGSNKKVWWKCPEGDDHEWKAAICDRQKYGCSICAGQKTVLSNCLAKTNPKIALEWHLTKNGDLTPYDVTAGCKKKVWWKCSKGDDHEWIAVVYDRQKQGCSICAGKKVVFSNCLATINPEIALEWHPTKNGDLTPYDVTAGCKKKVWWKCSKGDDHEWIATVCARQKQGCSICAGKKVVFSNCLATTNPEIALEWHPTKNGDLTPYDVTVGSGKKAWWRCSRGNDHEWEAVIADRKKYGCSICAGRAAVLSNCLATLCPEIALEWHPTKNGNLTPYNVTPGSNKKVWWVCHKNFDHEWKSTIASRRNHESCSICVGKTVVLSNCLATLCPEIALEWHPTKNGNLTPYNVTPGSNKKVWWQCINDVAHEWQAAPYNRLRKNARGCAICYKLSVEKKKN